MLVKEIKPGLDKWRKRWFSQVRKLIIVKMSILPKLIYRFNTIPIQIPAAFFVDTDKNILIFTWNDKGTRIAKTFMKGNNKLGAITLPDYDLLCSYNN